MNLDLGSRVVVAHYREKVGNHDRKGQYIKSSQGVTAV